MTVIQWQCNITKWHILEHTSNAKSTNIACREVFFSYSITRRNTAWALLYHPTVSGGGGISVWKKFRGAHFIASGSQQSLGESASEKIQGRTSLLLAPNSLRREAAFVKIQGAHFNASGPQQSPGGICVWKIRGAHFIASATGCRKP